MGSGGPGNEYCYISQLALDNKDSQGNTIFSGKNKSEVDFLKKIICECDNCTSSRCVNEYNHLCDHIKRYGFKKKTDSYVTDLTMNAMFDKLDKDNDGCIDVDEFKHLISISDQNLDVLNDLKDVTSTISETSIDSK